MKVNLYIYKPSITPCCNPLSVVDSLHGTPFKIVYINANLLTKPKDLKSFLSSLSCPVLCRLFERQSDQLFIMNFKASRNVAPLSHPQTLTTAVFTFSASRNF